MDEKYKKLKERYKEKCEKVKRLTRDNKSLRENENNFWDKWREMSKKYEMLCDSIGQNYYKVNYQAKNKLGNIHNFDKTILAPHPRIAISEIEEKNYVDYKFSSIEKIS